MQKVDPHLVVTAVVNELEANKDFMYLFNNPLKFVVAGDGRLFTGSLKQHYGSVLDWITRIYVSVRASLFYDVPEDRFMQCVIDIANLLLAKVFILNCLDAFGSYFRSARGPEPPSGHNINSYKVFNILAKQAYSAFSIDFISNRHGVTTIDVAIAKIDTAPEISLEALQGTIIISGIAVSFKKFTQKFKPMIEVRLYG